MMLSGKKLFYQKLRNIILDNLPDILKPYIKSALLKFKDDIIRKHGLKKCVTENRPCSKQHKSFRQWCYACSCWKTNILNIHAQRNKFPHDWKTFDSSKFPRNVNEVERCFYPRSNRNGDLNDIKICLKIIQNCTLFDDDTRMVARVVDRVRDDNVHNLNNISPQSAVQNILTLLRVCKENGGHPTTIENTEKLVEDCLLLFEQSNDLSTEALSISTITGKTREALSLFGLKIFLTTIFFSLLLPINRNDVFISGICMSDKSLTFHPRLKLHTEFVGREWLFSEVEDLLTSENKDIGILVIADMGYGKSAFISKMICPHDSHSAIRINTKVVAFHLCLYHRFYFRSAEHFVRNLQLMFKDNIPIFRIVDNQNIGEECSTDPLHCYTKYILDPLHEITYMPWNMLLIIDALDECGMEEQVSVYGILSETYRFHPRWLKFVVTSQNNKLIRYQFQAFRQIKLYKNDERNHLDVLEFLHSKQGYLYENELPRGHPPLFLYVRFLIKYWKPGEPLPSCIYGLHRLQLKRVFGRTIDMFYKYRDIFAVLAAAQQPLHEHTLYNILEFSGTNVDDRYEFQVKLFKMSPFLVDAAESGMLELAHESLIYFLTVMGKGQRFYVNVTRGHTLIANYQALRGTDKL